MDRPRLAPFVTSYLDRVVNRRDVSAVDDLVSPAYVGSGPGWPTELSGLRRFYVEQYRDRPDWRIDVQETVELGASVVVRALAGGSALTEAGREHRRFAWLARYQVHEGLIARIDLLEAVRLHPDGDAAVTVGAAPGPPTRP